MYYAGGRVVFGALTCGSWSCQHCLKRLSAQLLDRLRRGMESRPDLNRILVTLTIDRGKFGGRIIDKRLTDDGRLVNVIAEPTLDQFKRAAAALSREFDNLNKRLASKARRAGLGKFGYFRVIERHLDGWPHYHVVYEHERFTAAAISLQLAGWSLGRVDARDVSLDDAIGEVAPYLVSAERKGDGSKAYQFAGCVLPEGFRLYSPSRGFLADPKPSEAERPLGAKALRGHFTKHVADVRAYAEQFEAPLDVRYICRPPAPPELPHDPPGSAVATGTAAGLYFTQLVQCEAAVDDLLSAMGGGDHEANLADSSAASPRSPDTG